jgi:hypothetical protein
MFLLYVLNILYNLIFMTLNTIDLNRATYVQSSITDNVDRRVPTRKYMLGGFGLESSRSGPFVHND